MGRDVPKGESRIRAGLTKRRITGRGPGAGFLFKGVRAGANKGRPDSSRKAVKDGARMDGRDGSLTHQPERLQIRPTFGRDVALTFEPDSI